MKKTSSKNSVADKCLATSSLIDSRWRVHIFFGLIAANGASHVPEPLRLGEFEYLARANRRLLLAWLALFIAIVWAAISLALDVFANEPLDDSSHWFQRSGAVLVAAALWVEFESAVVDFNSFSRINILPTERYRFLTMFFSRISLALAVVGTLLWAYGDWVT